MSTNVAISEFTYLLFPCFVLLIKWAVFDMNDLQKNDVSPFNQVHKNVFLVNNSGIRILFVGNSITKHEPKPESGWFNDCGMEASSLDKDYVHILVERIKKYDKNVAYGIAQVANYERQFFTRCAAEDYQLAGDFDADIVVMFFGANVYKEYETMETPPKTFEAAFEDMRNLTSNNGKAKVFVSEGFYIRPRLEQEKRAVCARTGDTYMYMGDIQTRAETHGGRHHPNDLGMQEIADLFWKYMEPEVIRLTQKKD